MNDVAKTAWSFLYIIFIDMINVTIFKPFWQENKILKMTHILIIINLKSKSIGISFRILLIIDSRLVYISIYRKKISDDLTSRIDIWHLSSGITYFQFTMYCRVQNQRGFTWLLK